MPATRTDPARLTGDPHRGYFSARQLPLFPRRYRLSAGTGTGGSGLWVTSPVRSIVLALPVHVRSTPCAVFGFLSHQPHYPHILSHRVERQWSRRSREPCPKPLPFCSATVWLCRKAIGRCDPESECLPWPGRSRIGHHTVRRLPLSRYDPRLGRRASPRRVRKNRVHSGGK